MEIRETLHNIVPVADNYGGFQIKDYHQVKALVDDYIAQNLHKDLIITDNGSLKVLTESRTDIRKNKELLKDIRLSCIAMFTAELDRQFKELEKSLEIADLDLKKRVDEYKESQGKVKAPIKITLTIKGYDLNKLKLVQEFAIGAGLEAIIKE